MLPTFAFYTVLAATPIALRGGPPVGMDYLAYDAANHRVWVAERGALSVAATAQTAPGARNPLLDGEGIAYIPDTLGGRLIVIKPAP